MAIYNERMGGENGGVYGTGQAFVCACLGTWSDTRLSAWRRMG